MACAFLVPMDAKAQAEEVNERYTAFSVATAGRDAGVLEIAVTRWSTEDERKLLVHSMIQDGQEKTVELLRKQEETGWFRLQSGANSNRLHYAYQFTENGKRGVVLMTDRTVGIREVGRSTRSSEYDVSAVLMEFTQDGDEESGQGVYYPAVKFSFNKEKNTLEIEHLGTQPVRLTEIKRQP